LNYKIVVIRNFFEQVENSEVYSMMMKILAIKKNGYHSRHSERFMPVGEDDFFGIHVAICDESNMEPIVCYKVTPYSDCVFYNSAFPVDDIAPKIYSEINVKRIQNTFQDFHQRNEDYSYSGGWAMNTSYIKYHLSDKLREIYTQFSDADAMAIKKIELVTNHDVKAVEYFIKEKFDALNLQSFKEFIHFGLTSQDINNTAIPLSLKEATQTAYIPTLEALIEQLKSLSDEWADVPLLARTHGQPASPTRLGKEIMVFVVRLENQLKDLKTILMVLNLVAQLEIITHIL